MAELFVDTIILLSVALCGWAIFSLLKIPIAPLLGSIFVIGTVRLLYTSLPVAPSFFPPVTMLFLGYYVGSQVTRDKVCELKTMILPVAIIILWSLTIAFLVGSLLSVVSSLDLYTAILSSCIGGLAEVTIIAVDTGADVAIVTFIHSFRMVTTVILFPLIYRRWIDLSPALSKTFKHKTRDQTSFQVNNKNTRVIEESQDNMDLFYVVRSLFASKTSVQDNTGSSCFNSNNPLIRAGISIGVASAGAYLLWSLGVPAGPMVGSMLFVAALSLAGFNVISVSPNIFGFLLIGVGVIVGNNITIDTIEAAKSTNVLLIATLLTSLIMASSILVAITIKKVSGWDFATSFLAASPAGLSVMTPLAVKFHRNPFRVSMLHLCRLLAINTLVPFVFMFINR